MLGQGNVRKSDKKRYAYSIALLVLNKLILLGMDKKYHHTYRGGSLLKSRTCLEPNAIKHLSIPWKTKKLQAPRSQPNYNVI
jgi:hypothetical protein